MGYHHWQLLNEVLYWGNQSVKRCSVLFLQFSFTYIKTDTQVSSFDTHE
jgi:hypothetical protein